MRQNRTFATLTDKTMPVSTTAAKRSQLRIAYVITGLEKGGAELQLYRLAHAMHKRAKVLVVSLTGGGDIARALRADGIPVIELYGGLTLFFKLRAALKQFRPTIIHSYMWHANIASRVAAIGLRAKILCSVRVLEDIYYRLIADKLTRFLVDAYVSNSRVVAQKQLPPETTVIYNGVPASLWKGVQRNPKKKQALMVAHLRREKDHDTLFAVAARMPDWQFLCAGSGPRQQELETQLRKRSIKNVQLLGTVHDVPQRMSEATCLVHLTHREGMPNAVIEALLLGVPVIASDIPEIREVLEGKGTLVPPRNVKAVMSALRAVREPEATIRETAKNTFSNERMIREHQKLYKQLVTTL